MTTLLWRDHKIVRAFSVLILVAVLAIDQAAQWGGGQALAAEYAAGDSVVVDTDYLNFRTGASLSAAVISVLPNGTALTVTAGPETADGHDWYRVRTADNTNGWVAGRFLSIVSSWERFVAGDAAVVDTLWLNCRSGPGLSEDVIYVMELGTGVTILDGPSAANGYHWYKVRTDDGDIGWVADEFLVPAGSQGGNFAKGEQVVVDTDLLNLRSGAGLSRGIVDALPDGTALIVSNGPIAADDYDWYEVETRDGQLGWVAGAYLATAPGLGFAVGDAVRVANGAQNLRDEPSLGAAVNRIMDDDEVLLARGGPIEADGYTWYRVWNFGGEGWAAGEFLRFDPNGFPTEDGG